MEAKDVEGKEFWEGCGIKFKHVIGEGWMWQNPDNYGWFYGSPPIDLNNLSRYAIPKLIKEYRNWKSVLHDWVDELTGDYEKDALALFWALDPIITGKEKK